MVGELHNLELTQVKTSTGARNPVEAALSRPLETLHKRHDGKRVLAFLDANRAKSPCKTIQAQDFDTPKSKVYRLPTALLKMVSQQARRLLVMYQGADHDHSAMLDNPPTARSTPNRNASNSGGSDLQALPSSSGSSIGDHPHETRKDPSKGICIWGRFKPKVLKARRCRPGRSVESVRRPAH